MRLSRILWNHFQEMGEDLPSLPNPVEWLLPLASNPETQRVFHLFLEKYYADTNERTLILGINPGRFGGGITQVAFTDPFQLETRCGIPNSFAKKTEVSAQFIHSVIDELGGVEDFFSHYFVSSVCPWGFTKMGNNYNYYDQKDLQEAVEPLIIKHLKGINRIAKRDCICIGDGKNYAYLSKLNEKYHLYETITPLPHPRFIMQYKRKQLDAYIQKYKDVLTHPHNGV